MLEATDLEIVSQDYCTRKYQIPWNAPNHDLHTVVRKELPNLLQNNLMCAAHDVCKVTVVQWNEFKKLILLIKMYIF